MKKYWFAFKRKDSGYGPFVLELNYHQVVTARARKDKKSGKWYIEAVLIERHNLQKDEFIVSATDYQIARHVEISTWVKSLKEVPKVFAEATIPMKIVKKLYGKVFYPEWTGWENRESIYYVLEPIEKIDYPMWQKDIDYAHWLSEFEKEFVDEMTKQLVGKYSREQILEVVDEILRSIEMDDKLYKKYLQSKEKEVNPEAEKEKDFTWWKRDFKAEFISDVIEALEGRYTWEQISPIVDEIFNKPKIREKLYQKYLKVKEKRAKEIENAVYFTTPGILEQYDTIDIMRFVNYAIDFFKKHPVTDMIILDPRIDDKESEFEDGGWTYKTKQFVLGGKHVWIKLDDYGSQEVLREEIGDALKGRPINTRFVITIMLPDEY